MDLLNRWVYGTSEEPHLSSENAMKITQLYVYPIKSLRGISPDNATFCAQGLKYDRRYTLLKILPNGEFYNMFVGSEPEMALFHCSSNSPESFTVEYHTPDPPISPATPSQSIPIEIPFEPSPAILGDEFTIKTYDDHPYPARYMPKNFNDWFSACFGYECVLAFTSHWTGVSPDNENAKPWLPLLKSVNSSAKPSFSDSAALLVVSEASLEDLHPRLPDGEFAVLEKFRPNIVVDGPAGKPWDEDYWGELTLPSLGGQIVLTSNCARCTSINVDLSTGRMGTGESGKLLKKLMRDRRIDKGKKWEPVFGRYGFPTRAGTIRVGDAVVVSKRNQEYAVWNGLVPRLAQIPDAVSA